ncbi:iron chelate uptake ABC transporter family permease subunit [Streptococcus didelphis]|uniref:ABC transporter permease n=1 Tax=Streptococcus didelphis TaxID=102886 RepID=UPI00037D1FA7|nr:iron chelate uptake ABC transporter family permease subunit [Streptococcus didelphis]WMB28943.1 iron chelate uptake ABC transporter family permease subunit [Streptococcus didelphis]
MKRFFSTPVLGVILVLLSLFSILIGVKTLALQDGLTLSESQIHILLTSRIPRTISIIIAGAALSVCGLIMQLLTRNQFVSPTTIGTMDWAKLGIVICLIFFNQASLILQLILASLFAICGSLFFVLILKWIKFKDDIYIPLMGLMLGQFVSGFATLLGTKYQILQSLNSWLQGNFAIVTSHRYELLYFALPCLLITYLFAHQFTIVSLGESMAKNLGLSYDFWLLLGFIIVSIMTSLVITVVGMLPFLGLVVPNLVRLVKGDLLRNNLVLTSLAGANLVMVCDIVGRLLIFPYEIPIGLIMGVLGSITFLAILLKRSGRMV